VPVDPVAAAAHLLSPVNTALGLQLRLTGRAGGVRTLHFRRTEQVLSTTEAADAVAKIRSQISSAHVEGDEYLSLVDVPGSWMKPLRTGSRVVLFGSDVLFGSPLISMSAELAAAPGTGPAAWAELRCAAVLGPVLGDLPAAGGPALLAGTPVWVRRTAGSVFIDRDLGSGFGSPGNTPASAHRRRAT
jgi:hypothetical protein